MKFNSCFVQIATARTCPFYFCLNFSSYISISVFVLGIAYRGLQGKTLYPMVSSTAARSGMKMITSRSFRTSLQFMCCQELRRLVPEHLAVLEAVPLPPGLKAFLENNMGWMLQPYCMAKVNVPRKRPLSVSEDAARDVEDREDGCPPVKCASKSGNS